MKLYDITRAVTPALQVWPGDSPYSTDYLLRLDAGASVNLSTVTISGHGGTHADAFYHFDDDGLRVGAMPLDAYIGPATVVDLSAALPDGGPILPGHLAQLRLEQTRRLLVKSRASSLPDDEWNVHSTFLAPETAELLVAKGLRLFGTDAPSVDPQDSTHLPAHKILGRGGVAILEVLQLRDVPPGVYELIALPLKLDNDGSPVRAVLRSREG